MYYIFILSKIKEYFLSLLITRIENICYLIKDTLINMSISDSISCIATIITFLGIITTFIISIITLKQNNKFKREETRAIIVCYIEHITKTGNSYITIKNFGKSVGEILDIKLIPNINLNEILGITNSNFKNIFERKNFILAPNQKISSWYDFINYKIEHFKVIIRYKTLEREYVQEYELSPEITQSVLSVEKNKSNRSEELNILSNIADEIKEISERI